MKALSRFDKLKYNMFIDRFATMIIEPASKVSLDMI